MNDVVLLTMEKHHLQAVWAISTLSFPIPWSMTSFEKELENNYARYMVASIDGNVVGYGGMWLIIDEAHITNIAVHPEYRGFGIGDAILNSMIDICKREKAFSMSLEVRVSNLVAQNLYSKFGFKKQGVRKKYYEDNGEDALLMCKTDL